MFTPNGPDGPDGPTTPRPAPYSPGTASKPAPPTPYAAFPDVCALLLTSGSTGAANAFGFTRAALAASAAAVAHRLDLTPDDRWALSLSLGHVGGLSLVVRAMMTGASVRLWPAFDADALAGAVVRQQVTHLAVVPVMLRRLLARLAGRPIPPSLRCVLVGGAAASPALLDDGLGGGPSPRHHLGHDRDRFPGRHRSARPRPPPPRHRGASPARHRRAHLRGGGAAGARPHTGHRGRRGPRRIPRRRCRATPAAGSRPATSAARIPAASSGSKDAPTRSL